MSTELQILDLQLDLVKLEKAFDPNEPRDYKGRWSDIGLKQTSNKGKHHSFEIMQGGKESGAKLHLDVSDPETLYIDWVGKEIDHLEPHNFDYYKPIQLGPSAIMRLARQLKEIYPNAKRVKGERVGGARTKAGKHHDVVSVTLAKGIAEAFEEQELQDLAKLLEEL